MGHCTICSRYLPANQLRIADKHPVTEEVTSDMCLCVQCGVAGERFRQEKDEMIQKLKQQWAETCVNSALQEKQQKEQKERGNMQINGYDVRLPHRVTENTETCILRVFRMFWPNMVVERAKFAPAFFVYENAEHKKNWDVEGWTEQSAHSMVDVWIDKDAACVMLTVEDPKHPVTQRLIAAIRSALRGLPR